MKTNEEMNAIKAEYITLNSSAEITEDELNEVAGGTRPEVMPELDDFFRQSYNFIG